MKQRSFLANLLFILVINLIIKPLYVFGVEVNVQNAIGSENYGLFFALLNSAYLLQIINDFGLQIFNNREVAINQDQIRGLIPGLTSVKIIFSGIYLTLLFSLGYLLGYQEYMLLFVVIGINLILTSFILYFRSGISGLGFHRTDSIFSAADKFLMILIIGGLLLFLPEGQFNVYHFVLGQSAALLLTLLAAGVTLARVGHFRIRKIQWQSLKPLISKALPYALVVFLMTLYTRSDGVMLKALLTDGDNEAGIYAAGYRILDALNMVAFLFAVMLLPMFSRVLDRPRELSRLANEGMRYMALLVLPVVSFSLMFSEEITTLLYVEADAYWGQVFALLMTSFLATGLMYVFGTLLTSAGRLRQMNLIYSVCVLLNILLNFILIPQYKAYGAAVATVSTQLFAAISIAVLCFRTIEITVVRREFVEVVVFAIICTGAFWFLGRVLFPDQWYLSLSGMAVVTIASALALRIARPGELRQILGAANDS